MRYVASSAIRHQSDPRVPDSLEKVATVGIYLVINTYTDNYSRYHPGSYYLPPAPPTLSEACCQDIGRT